MSKKAILSTLLISSALLGTTVAANAATSGIKAESKLVTVEKSNAKIYKNSKLQESKTVKKGTVYKVNGYRDINGKKYYRVYQEDTKGKVVYKGYILDKDTKVLKGQKPAKKDRFVGVTKADQTAWKSLYFNKKIKTYDGTKHASNFEVKHTYKIGDKTYYSLYRGEKWMGYMDDSGFKVLTPKHLPEDKQAYEVIKDYETYNDIYFTEKGQLKVGEKVKVKNIYTFGNGRHYGSLYNEEGKWIGYANMHALKAVEASTPEEPGKPDEPTTPEKPDTKPEETELEKAKKAAEEAKKGTASKEDIKKVTDELEKAIAGVKLDTTNLKDALEATKQLVKDYYLTKDQEAKLNKVFDEVQKVVDNAKTDSKADIDAAKAKLDKIANDLKVQPTYAQGQALSEVIAKANKLKAHEEVAKVLFEDFNGVKSAYDEATDTMTELKKDAQFGENTATKEMTAQDVEAVAKKLNDALDNLKINANNTKAFYDEAKKAIDGLQADNKADAEAKLKAFEDAAKKGTAKDINEILDSAKALVKAIDDAQNKELKEAIDKAEKIISDNNKYKAGNETDEGEDFYTQPTFDKLKEELKKAQEAIQLTPATITKETAHKKAKAKTALDTAINDLQINHWDSEVRDGKVVLTEYKPLDVKKKENLEISSDQKDQNPGQAFRKDRIVIPGRLKDMPVVLELKYNDKTYANKIIQNTDLTGGTTTIDGDKKYYVSAQKVPVTFKEVDGQKVLASATLNSTFQGLGNIDVTGLDTSETTSFYGMFKGNFGSSIKGIEDLNTSKGTDFSAMFSDAKNLTSLDLSKWDMTSATKLGSMFFGTSKLKDLNLSGWKLTVNDATHSPSTDGMFGKTNANNLCGVIEKVTETSDKDAKEEKYQLSNGFKAPTDVESKKVIDNALKASYKACVTSGKK